MDNKPIDLMGDIVSLHPAFLVMLLIGSAILANFAWQVFKLFCGDYED